MLLGELIAHLGEAGVAEEALLAVDDLALVVAVRREVERSEATVEDVLLGAIGEFSATASSDDWLALMSALGRSDNPGSACLAAILRRSLDLRAGAS